MAVWLNSEFKIDRAYKKKKKKKKKVFVAKTKTKKHIFISMIVANGLKKGMYSEELITGVATLDDLFQ